MSAHNTAPQPATATPNRPVSLAPRDFARQRHGPPDERRKERAKLHAPRIVLALGLDLRERGGRLRGNCPWRPDSNSGAFSLDPATGGWTDFARDESGDVFDLVARLECGLDRAADDFPRALDRAAELAGLRPGVAGPSPEILERQRRECAKARQATPREINGPRPWRRFRGREDAEAHFAFLAEALDPGDHAFFAERYSIPELPGGAVAPWIYPSPIQEVDPGGSAESRIGWLYATRGEGGALEAVKFKTRARTLKQGKRASRGVWGSKAALLGADLLPLAEGGTIIVTAGEEKALAGNAHAQRLGLSVVFVASLFGEGFSADHGPKQARRLVEAGPARIVLAGDADAAGAKFNSAWRAGLIQTGFDPQLIRALAWPEGARIGHDVNDALATEGADALFARIAAAEPMPDPAPAPVPKPVKRRHGLAMRARIKLAPVVVPRPETMPLDALRAKLWERLASLETGGKLLVATGPGTGKTTAAAHAAARELATEPTHFRRVLIVAQTDTWATWRRALEAAGVQPERIAELQGRHGGTCKNADRANELFAAGQNVHRVLCGVGLPNPANPSQTARGGEKWTGCHACAVAKGQAGAGLCSGAGGQEGYLFQRERARLAAVLLVTPERAFGPDLANLEGSWHATLVIVDEGVGRQLVRERVLPTDAAAEWRRRWLAKSRQAVAGPWLERLRDVAPERAALLEAARLQRAAYRDLAEVAERDAWAAWAAKAWPEEAAPLARLAGEVRALLANLPGGSGPLDFEAATSFADNVAAGFRECFAALARDLEAPEAEPWLAAGVHANTGAPVWLIRRSGADDFAGLLGDPSRKVVVLDATPSAEAKTLLARGLGFDVFAAEAPDDTRVVQLRGGGANGSTALRPPKSGEPDTALPRHEARLVAALEAEGADPGEALAVTHKGRKSRFRALAVATHFGAHRGRNDMADAPALLVDGRPMAPADVLARECRLLERVLLERGLPLPEVHPLVAASLPDPANAERVFLPFAGDPAGVAVSVRSTGCPRVDSFTLRGREAEVRQLVGRARGVNRTARGEAPALVVIVTDDPLGLVAVDAFREVSDLAKRLQPARDAHNAERSAKAAESATATIAAAKSAILAECQAGGAPTLATIAAAIGTSRRTLCRALKRNDLSFPDLLAEAQEQGREDESATHCRRIFLTAVRGTPMFAPSPDVRPEGNRGSPPALPAVPPPDRHQRKPRP